MKIVLKSVAGSAWGDWSLYTASPLRAGKESKVARNFFGGDTTSYASFDPATELGVQDPIGFWDPLGGAHYIQMHPHASTFIQQAGSYLI